MELDKKLHLDSLDNNERKDLFEQFIAHGGKVVDGQPKNPNASSKKGDIVRNNKSSSSSFQDYAEDSKKTVPLKKEKEVPLKKEISLEDYLKSNKINIFGKFFGRMSAFLSRISNFGFTEITSSFFFKSEKVVNHHLNILKNLSSDIFALPFFKNHEFVSAFYMNYPMFFEIIYRFTQLKTEKTSLFFTDTRKLKVSFLKDGYLEFIRMFYPFLNKKNHIIMAYQKILKVAFQLKEIDSKAFHNHNKILKEVLDFIYDEFLTKLDIIYPLMVNYHIPLESKATVSLLNIKEQDCFGSIDGPIRAYLDNLDASKNGSGNSSEPKELSEKEENLQKLKDQGMLLLSKIPISKKRVTNGEYYFLDSRDKILICTGIFEYLLEHYSILMSKNKVRFMPNLFQGKKISLEASFQDFVLEMQKINRYVKDYGVLIKKIMALDPPQANQQTEFDKLCLQRNKANQNLRTLFYNNMSKLLQIISLVMEQPAFYIESHDTPLVLKDSPLSSEFYFHGKTPEFILREFYSVLLALKSHLAQGELGNSSFKIEPTNKMFELDA